MSARAVSAEQLLAAAAAELAAGLALLEPVLIAAEDASSPGYRLDAIERAQLREHVNTFHAWREQHGKLLEWAHRQAHPRRRRARARP